MSTEATMHAKMLVIILQTILVTMLVTTVVKKINQMKKKKMRIKFVIMDASTIGNAMITKMFVRKLNIVT